MKKNIDYFFLFKELLCNEIAADPEGTGGGQMNCPSQIVSRNPERIAKNLAFIKKNGIKIDSKIEEFYSQIASIEIYWKPEEFLTIRPIIPSKDDLKLFPQLSTNPNISFCKGSPPLHGYMKIYDLERLINDPDGNKWKDILWFDHMNTVEKKFWQQFVVFDKSIPEVLILMKIDKTKIDNRLFFYYVEDDEPTELNIGIEEYMTFAYKVKVFESWQYALNKNSSLHDYTLKRMKHYLPQIFPKLKFDFSDFK